MDHPTLKPCPFCGSANVGRSFDKHPIGHEIIVCIDCGSQGPANYKIDIDLADAWNKRPAEGEKL